MMNLHWTLSYSSLKCAVFEYRCLLLVQDVTVPAKRAAIMLRNYFCDFFGLGIWSLWCLVEHKRLTTVLENYEKTQGRGHECDWSLASLIIISTTLVKHSFLRNVIIKSILSNVNCIHSSMVISIWDLGVVENGQHQHKARGEESESQSEELPFDYKLKDTFSC